jgi:hypothetical protein
MTENTKSPPPSLYEVLGEPAPPSSTRGETQRSAAKETIDRDVEMLILEEQLYDLLSTPAPAGSGSGETINTREKETVDNDAEMLTLEELIHHV